MKFLIISLAVLACAYAGDESAANVVRSDFENNDKGFHYAFETENGIFQQANGHVKQVGQEVALEIEGSNQYTAPDGQKVQLTYTADENGYHPQGEHLPTPPPTQPIPEYILRSLEYNAAHPQKEKY